MLTITSAKMAEAVMAKGNSGIACRGDTKGFALTRERPPTIAMDVSASNNPKITWSVDLIELSL
jgi:hypothetical protein